MTTDLALTGQTNYSRYTFHNLSRTRKQSSLLKLHVEPRNATERYVTTVISKFKKKRVRVQSNTQTIAKQQLIETHNHA